MNLAIWDIESSSASTDFGSIIEIGGILVDENFKEKDRFNLRCRLPEGVIFQAMALIVNKTSIKKLTQANLSHYQMLAEVEKIFKKWSPAIFLGWSNIGFDDEMIRKEFFKGIRYPYLIIVSVSDLFAVFKKSFQVCSCFFLTMLKTLAVISASASAE